MKAVKVYIDCRDSLTLPSASGFVQSVANEEVFAYLLNSYEFLLIASTEDSLESAKEYAGSLWGENIAFEDISQ